MLTYKASILQMRDDLSRFGDDLSYPLYMTFVDMSSFFSDRRKVLYGYMALTNDKNIVIVSHNLFGECGEYRIPLAGISSVKIKKTLLGAYSIKLQALSDGKKVRLEMTIPLKARGTDLEEQENNVMGIVGELEKFK